MKLTAAQRKELDAAASSHDYEALFAVVERVVAEQAAPVVEVDAAGEGLTEPEKKWLQVSARRGLLTEAVERIVASHRRTALQQAADGIDLSAWYDPSPQGGVTKECANAEAIAARYLRALADRDCHAAKER